MQLPILFIDVLLASTLFALKRNSNMYAPLAHFLYKVKAPLPMGNPSQQHKNKLRVCLYFTHQNLVGIWVYLLPKHLLNRFCSHPHHSHCFSSISYFTLLIFLPLVSPHSITSSNVTKMSPSINARRAIRFKIT